MAVIAVIAVVGAGLGIIELRREASRPVTVQDAGGQISLDVPRAWARERVPGGWDPAVLKLSAGHAAGLTVADHAGEWGNLETSVNGVFVGLSTDPHLPAAVQAITHPSCTPAGDQPWTSTSWRGQVRRWRDCRGGARTLTEISLTGTGSAPARAYVQIRQDGGSDDVQKVLKSLRAHN